MTIGEHRFQVGPVPVLKVLLLLNAGKDTSVPPDAARRFASTHADRGVEYVEYPHSEHLMRPDDWDDLWSRALDFLRRQPGVAR